MFWWDPGAHFGEGWLEKCEQRLFINVTNGEDAKWRVESVMWTCTAITSFTFGSNSDYDVHKLSCKWLLPNSGS